MPDIPQEPSIKNDNSNGMPVVTGDYLPCGAFSIKVNRTVVNVNESDYVYGKIFEKATGVAAHIILSIENCPILSSATIGTIASLAIIGKESRKKIILAGAPDKMRETFQICGLEDIFIFCENEQQAAEYIENINID